MTTYIIKQIPDFPYKNHLFKGGARALDWVAQLRPDLLFSAIWAQVREKAQILDGCASLYGVKKKVVAVRNHLHAGEEPGSKKSLQITRAGAQCAKIVLSTAKAVDKWVVSFLTPLTAQAISLTAAGMSIVASTALVGMETRGLYENRDVTVTGEKALIHASGRFLSSVYGLVIAILLVVALVVHFPVVPFLVLTLMTLIFLTNLCADVYLAF